MSKKQKLKNLLDDLKRWAIDNTSDSGVHSIIQKIKEEVDTMGDGECEGNVDHPGKKAP